MAQLSDDCFAFGGPLMSVEDALAIISKRIVPVSETERVGLNEVDGRVLAHDLVAPLPLPPFMNSAVDGYAISSSDLPQGAATSFEVTGRVQAGASGHVAIAAGKAIRIFTGAPMPAGADTVFMQEDVQRDGKHVILPAGLKPGANVRPAGEDISQGDVALKAGRRMKPQDVALAAALGLTDVLVRRRVRVGVLSTGNEVTSPGKSRTASQLYDSNRFMLMAMLRRLGCEASDLGIVADDPVALGGVLKHASASHDLILTSGGVSTGEEDHVKTAVEATGSLVLWRMAIKPGRPVAMGVIGGAAFIGLPGNPVASFVTFAHVVRPTLLALAGSMPEPLLALPVRAAFGYKKKSGRREYVRVSLRRAAHGVVEAVKFPREGAGLLSSLTQTDGLVELEEHVTGVEPGETVGFLSYQLLL